MSTKARNAANTETLRLRLLEMIEDGPRTERTLTAMSNSSQEIVSAVLQEMYREGMVIPETIVITVWRITSSGRRVLGL